MNPIAQTCCPAGRRLRVGMWLSMAGLTVAFLVASYGVNTMADAREGRLLRHVVEFKFQDSSTKEDIQKIVDGFRALPSKISAVADFEYGTDSSPEGLANGFTHCFLLTFRSEADRDVYLQHPEHQKFVDVLKPHLDKVQVIDYWAEK